MKIICKKCRKKFIVHNNPTNKLGVFRMVSKGVRHRGRLCNSCWKKSKNNQGMKGRKGTSYKGMTLKQPRAIFYQSGSNGVKLLYKRNNEITKLKEMVKNITSENVRLKDDVKVLNILIKNLEKARK